MTKSSRVFDGVAGVLGALAGATLGYYTFRWLLQQGFYGMVIPGALLGLGCGLASRTPSPARGVACAVAAVALGLFVEWKFHPFVVDASFKYLLLHVADLKGATLLMIALGAAFAYWLGKEAGAGRFRRPGASVD